MSTVIQRVLRAKTVALEQKKYRKQKAPTFSLTWLEQRGLRSIIVKPNSQSKMENTTRSKQAVKKGSARENKNV